MPRRVAEFLRRGSALGAPRMRSWAGPVMILMVASGVGMGAVQRADAAQDPAPVAVPKPSLTVSITQPQRLTLPIQLTANGSLAAWQESVIGAQTNGLQVTDVRVNVGDQVRKGDLIATLQPDTVRAELAQARAALAETKANLEEARAQAERARSLQSQGFYSGAQLTQSIAGQAAAQARLESAQAAVQLHQARLEQTQVHAPDSGVISARSATIGSVVGVGSELFRLIRQGRIEWRAEVTANEVGRIVIGAPVRLTAASGVELRGRVRVIAPSVDPQTRNALVYVDVLPPLGSARAGMYARGVFELGQSQALGLPQTAVVVRDGFSYVYRVGDDDKVVQSKVQTGRLLDDRIEIVGGLDASARVVATGAAFLNNGDRVRVLDSPPLRQGAAAPGLAPKLGASAGAAVVQK